MEKEEKGEQLTNKCYRENGKGKSEISPVSSSIGEYTQGTGHNGAHAVKPRTRRTTCKNNR